MTAFSIRSRTGLGVLVLGLVALPPLLRAQDASGEISPGENLVVEGIPKIPRSVADEVGRYTEIRQAYFASWNPAKREMLIVTRFANTYQVHSVAFPGGARRQLTFFRENITSGIRYAPHGDSFIFLKDVGGDENYQLFRYDLASGDSTLLTDGKSRNTSDVLSNAGDRIAYGSTRRNGNDVDLWVVSPADPRSDRLLVELSGGGWEPLDWSPDDKQILLMEGISASESYLWLVDSATGRKRLLTPKGAKQKVSYTTGRFSKDGKGLYVATDRDSEFLRLAYIDLATGKHVYLSTDIPWDLDELDVSPNGSRVAFVTNEDGMGILHLLDAATRRELPVPKLPVGVISGIRWRPNEKELAFNFESSRNASDAYTLDVTSGKLERWTFSETGGLDASKFSEPELVHWKSFDGHSISGYLYKPPASFAGKRPVVIDIHGGPESQFRPYFLGGDFFIDKLGVAKIFPNVRGSTGYGKTFQTLDNGFRREDSYRDILALLDWIKTSPDLDADRVMVTGGSYGGFMTLAVATNYNDRIRCSLDVVGPSNLVTFLENTSGYRRDLRRVEYGDERDPKMREFLLRIAPANNASKITKPLFVVQGKNDPRVPFTESEQMVATVRKNGTPVWYLMAKDEGHGFGKKANQDYLTYAIVMFMKEFLLK